MSTIRSKAPILPPNPSKQEEIDYFKAWVAELPSVSYLRSMFKDAPSDVEGMIRNDFAFSPLADMRKQQHDEMAVVKLLQQEQSKLQDANRNLIMQNRTLQAHLTEARETLASIQRQARAIANLDISKL